MKYCTSEKSCRELENALTNFGPIQIIIYEIKPMQAV